MPKVAGSQKRVKWNYEFVDIGLIPRMYLTPDDKKIGGIVRTLEAAATKEIPGIRVWAETSLENYSKEIGNEKSIIGDDVFGSGAHVRVSKQNRYRNSKWYFRCRGGGRWL